MNYEMPQEYLTYLIIIYCLFCAFLFYKLLLANRGKILVRIKTPIRENTKWIKPEADGKTIIVEKENKRKKRPEWKFEFDNTCIGIQKGKLKTKQVIDVFYGAPKAIAYNYTLQETEQPLWNKADETNLFKANVIKAAGATTQKIQIPTILYVLIFMGVILSFITLLVTSGRVRMY